MFAFSGGSGGRYDEINAGLSFLFTTNHINDLVEIDDVIVDPNSIH